MNKSKNVLIEVRRAMKASGKSVYRIAQDAGLRYEVARRIAVGALANAHTATVSAIGDALGYELRFTPKRGR